MANVVDTHSWKTERDKTNSLGEPTYVQRCSICGLTARQVKDSGRTCVKGDERK